MIVDDINVKDAKTSALPKQVGALGWKVTQSTHLLVFKSATERIGEGPRGNAGAFHLAC